MWYNKSMSLFNLFKTRKPPLQMVVDVGSHAIKALLFYPVRSQPRRYVGAADAILSHRTSNGVEKPIQQPVDKSDQVVLPKIVKKMFFKLPISGDQAKVVARLREFMFTTVKEFERVPEKIVIAVGPNLAEESLQLWTVYPVRGKTSEGPDAPLLRASNGVNPSASVKKVSPRELGVYFQNLFEANRDPKLASLAYPFSFLANGYTATPKVIEQASVTEIGFQTLVLSFSEIVGARLAEMKQGLGGMPIEFVPLAAALKEAFVFSLGWPDIFLVDVGGEETTLILIKEGEVKQVGSFAVGAHHFLRGIAKISAITLEEAESRKRQYVQGLVGEKVRSKLQEFLGEESLVWKRAFLAKLDLFYHIGSLPAKILLFGGGAYLPEIVSILRGADWLGGFSYAAVPEVRIIEASSLWQGNSLGGFLQGPEDMGLASLIIYSLQHESYW